MTPSDGAILVPLAPVRDPSQMPSAIGRALGLRDTGEQSLTLITCGGAWNAAIAEYEESTVARAVQVDVLEAEESASSASSMPLAA